jgi:hypothetical protein
MTTNNIYLIGNQTEWESYSQGNSYNTDLLPIKNLPMCYFPFFYNNSELSIEKMKKIVALIENSSKVDEKNKEEAAKHTIDTEKLFNMLTLLEEPYQPYNNNNIYHIKIFIIIFWILIGFGILKIFYYIFKDKYIYFILLMIFLLLCFCIAWSLTITSKNI